MNAAAGLFDQVTAEDWLLCRLRQLGCHVADGLADTLRARVRSAILEQGYAMVVAGRKPTGGTELVEDAFQRVFQEPLTPKLPRRRSAP